MYGSVWVNLQIMKLLIVAGVKPKILEPKICKIMYKKIEYIAGSYVRTYYYGYKMHCWIEKEFENTNVF